MPPLLLLLELLELLEVLEPLELEPPELPLLVDEPLLDVVLPPLLPLEDPLLVLPLDPELPPEPPPESSAPGEPSGEALCDASSWPPALASEVIPRIPLDADPPHAKRKETPAAKDNFMLDLVLLLRRARSPVVLSLGGLPTGHFIEAG